MTTKTVHAPGRPALPASTCSCPAGNAEDADALLRGLYAEHGAVLLRLATQLTRGDSASAEDLVQEAMLRAWRRRPTNDFAVGSVRGWLTTTIRNLAIDAHRARQARPAEAGPDALPALVSPARTDSGIDSWPLRAAVAALPPHSRQVVVEIYYRDRSVADTARVLHIPPGTVKSRLNYALGVLRRTLVGDDAAA